MVCASWCTKRTPAKTVIEEIIITIIIIKIKKDFYSAISIGSHSFITLCSGL